MIFIQVSPDALINAPASRTQPTSAQLSRLAAMHQLLTTKKHAKAVLRANGLSASDANADALIARIREIRSARVNRVVRMFQFRTGQRLAYLPRPNGRPAVTLPAGRPIERLAASRKSTVISIAKSCFRCGAAGGTSFRVTLSGEPEAIGYKVSIESNWTTYAGAYKGWRANEDHHHITVPPDWRVRVLKRGLAIVDGLMTLTAQQLSAPNGVELFRATWAGQGRGFSVHVNKGYLARYNGYSFHGETAQEALKGVQRKARLAKAIERNLDLVEALNDSTSSFVSRLQEYSHLNVSLSDAYKTGACSFGVRSWCADVGIDIELGKVTLGRLLEGFQQCPLEEVRRTALYVVRRARRLQVQRLAARETTAADSSHCE